MLLLKTPISHFILSFMSSFAGEVVFVAQRLDARYDWLPSPHTLIHKHTRFNIAFYGNACSYKSEWEEGNSGPEDSDDNMNKKHKSKVREGRIALVSPGDCSVFTKVIEVKQLLIVNG